MRDSEKYEVVQKWMKYVGGGYTPKTGVLAVICRICRDEAGNYTQPCKLSTNTLASEVGCSRRQIFRAIGELCDEGYIKATKGARTQIVSYTVNQLMVDAAKDACDRESYDRKAYDRMSQDDEELMTDSHKTYDKQSQAYDKQSQGLCQDVTKLMTECHPNNKIQDNNTGNNTGRVSAREADAAYLSDFPEIRISDSERKSFEGLDFSKTGKSAKAYYAIMSERLKSGKQYTDHYSTLRKWAMQDGADTKKPSSIDDDLILKIMNPYNL